MKPIDFAEADTQIAEHQDEYITLPAHINRERGTMTCCWYLTRRERWRLLLTGKLWWSVWTGNTSLQPMRPDLKKPVELLTD